MMRGAGNGRIEKSATYLVQHVQPGAGWLTGLYRRKACATALRGKNTMQLQLLQNAQQASPYTWTMHVLIPSATSSDPTCQQLWQSLELPQLEALLSQLQGLHYTPTRQDGWLDPVQQILAVHFGLQEEKVFASAALERYHRGMSADGGWAKLYWCSLEPGLNDMTLHPPHALQIEPQDAKALLRLVGGWVAQEDMTLHALDNRSCWAHADWLAETPSVPLRRVACQGVARWLKPRERHKGLNRLLFLQNEVQMLLHDHPINAAREEKGLRPVNSFWVTGAGALPPDYAGERHDLQYIDALENATIAGDWRAWAVAWKELDNRLVPQWQAHADRGMPLKLTLCGDAKAFTWAGGQHQDSVWSKLGGLFSKEATGALKPGISWRTSLADFDF